MTRTRMEKRTLNRWYDSFEVNPVHWSDLHTTDVKPSIDCLCMESSGLPNIHFSHSAAYSNSIKCDGLIILLILLLTITSKFSTSPNWAQCACFFYSPYLDIGVNLIPAFIPALSLSQNVKLQSLSQSKHIINN